MVAPWLVPMLMFLLSVGLVWSPLDGAFGQDARRLDVGGLFRRDHWLRLVAGLVLGIVSLWWIAMWEYSDSALVRMVVTPLVIAIGIAVLLAPWWLRMIRQVSVEREERIREHERADIAAHLHDSVLQTLTLIRANSTDADAVARLARAQERDLRAYLYQQRRSAQESVAVALAAVVDEIEDTYGVTVETVVVGDAPTDEGLAAAVQAAREATANAARHGVGPISVYAEITARACEIYVRDGGPGFDPDAVSADRLGIRRSILGRAARHGGRAEIHSRPGDRTEVVIAIPRQESS